MVNPDSKILNKILHCHCGAWGSTEDRVLWKIIPGLTEPTDVVCKRCGGKISNHIVSVKDH